MMSEPADPSVQTREFLMAQWQRFSRRLRMTVVHIGHLRGLIRLPRCLL